MEKDIGALVFSDTNLTLLYRKLTEEETRLLRHIIRAKTKTLSIYGQLML